MPGSLVRDAANALYENKSAKAEWIPGCQG